MVEGALPDHETDFGGMNKVAIKLGVSPETIRRWKRRSKIEAGVRPWISWEVNQENKWLKQENI